MIELFVLKFQSFYSSSFLLKMLVFILFHSASFFIPLIFANFVNCLYFMFCFLQALYHCLGLKSFISVWKACIKRIFFSNLCFRYAIIRFEEYFARKNEFLSLQWNASWCFSSWSHISLPKLNLYGCFMPPRQTIYIIHLFGWNFLHRNFIMISLIYFVGIFFFFDSVFMQKKTYCRIDKICIQIYQY